MENQETLVAKVIQLIANRATLKSALDGVFGRIGVNAQLRVDKEKPNNHVIVSVENLEDLGAKENLSKVKRVIQKVVEIGEIGQLGEAVMLFVEKEKD